MIISRACPTCRSSLKLTQKDLFDDRYGSPGKHSVFSCPKCGFGKTIPGLNRQNIGKFYARYYPLSNENPKEMHSKVKIVTKFQAWLEGTDNTTHWYTRPGQKVLDIGSASGISLMEITDLGGDPYGVEPDPNGKRLAKLLGLKVHQGFITDNPFPKIKFDLITASQVIEHEPTPTKFLKSIRRKLNNQGQVVLSFPNYNALYRHIFGRRWLHWHIPYHLNFFTQASFRKLAKRTGFKIIKIRTITPNLWTILQLRVLIYQPKEGTVNPIWRKTSIRRSRNLAPQLALFDQILHLVAKLSVWGIMPINRLIDLVGLGESFLVIMRKSETS